MLAPVYRSLEAKNTMMGVSFPTEFVIVVASWWAGLLSAGAFIGSGWAVVVYVGIRVVNYGHDEGFVQHWLQWKARQLQSGGRLSAAARVTPRRARRFPFGEYSFEGEDLALRLAALFARTCVGEGDDSRKRAR